MKCLIFVITLYCLTNFAEMGVTKTSRESTLKEDSPNSNLEYLKLDGPKEAECLPGSEWESHCYSCSCSALGKAECKKQTTCEVNTNEQPIHCKPQTVFKRDCNTCMCLDDGRGLCTLIGCSVVNIEIPKIPSTSPATVITGKECAAGSSWKSRCNSCICAETGFASCTEKACIGQESEPELKCAPGTSWYDDCNTCFCTDYGFAECTRIGCDAHPIPNLNFNDDAAPKKPELKVEKTTKKNEKMDVTGELRIIKRECRPFEVFELDCNMCRCNSDGQSFSCTRRLCFTDPPVDVVTENKLKNTTLQRKVRATPAQEPIKTCQPGQEFRLDCNKCLCDNEGQDFSCTRIDCQALSRNDKPSRRKREVGRQETNHCEPGSVFDQDCNVCRCTSDGRHATCTLKRCSLAQPESDKDSQPTDSDPNFRCTAGEQFKRACNDCTCSADGLSVFCTLRLCDKDITPRI